MERRTAKLFGYNSFFRGVFFRSERRYLAKKRGLFFGFFVIG